MVWIALLVATLCGCLEVYGGSTESEHVIAGLKNKWSSMFFPKTIYEIINSVNPAQIPPYQARVMFGGNSVDFGTNLTGYNFQGSPDVVTWPPGLSKKNYKKQGKKDYPKYTITVIDVDFDNTTETKANLWWAVSGVQPGAGIGPCSSSANPVIGDNTINGTALGLETHRIMVAVFEEDPSKTVSSDNSSMTALPTVDLTKLFTPDTAFLNCVAINFFIVSTWTDASVNATATP